MVGVRRYPLTSTTTVVVIPSFLFFLVLGFLIMYVGHGTHIYFILIIL